MAKAMTPSAVTIRAGARAQGRALLTLALPLIGANLAQNAIQFVDVLMLGRYDVTALAAVSIAAPFWFLLFLFGAGFAWAVTPLVAEAAEVGDTQQVRRIARKWLPGMRWLRRTMLTSNVNLDLACNAFYSHAELSVNYYRSGDGCNNTGLIADVIHHEWGHAIDFATLVLDGSTGEGTADVIAMHMTRHPAIAPGFRVNGTPIRDLNSATNPLGFMTWQRVQNGACRP